MNFILLIVILSFVADLPPIWQLLYDNYEQTQNAHNMIWDLMKMLGRGNETITQEIIEKWKIL